MHPRGARRRPADGGSDERGAGARRRGCDASGAGAAQPRAALPADHLATGRRSRASGGEGMNATVAAQMTGADFLKLRKKRGTVIWASVLALAPLLIFFIVRAAQHSSDAAKYAPAGG